MTRRVGLIAALLFAGCAPTPLTTFAPKSDLAGWIVNLYWEIIGWDSLILLVVTGIFLLGVFRYSGRATEEIEPPRPTHTHLGLEVAWTVGPALVILAIAVPTVRLDFRSQASRPTPGIFNVRVVGHQWWWEIRYPDLGITTANEIHLPVGVPVQFRLESADVIHSFWVPQLGGKRDIIPGHVNALTLTPLVEGTYYGECGEFCGLSHANMRFRVVVDSAERFDAWKQLQLRPAALPQPGPDGEESATQAGQRVFALSACTPCHTINGVSTGVFGPDLTHVGGRLTLAGGILDNTPDNLRAWLRDPDALKPGAQMPKLAMNEQQLNLLVAYLESLK